MVIIETKPFERARTAYFDDDAFAAFTFALHRRPMLGVVVQGTGGVRKMRWQMPGHGKRGGVRVIYYIDARRETIYLLTAYAKNEAANLPNDLLKKMREVIDNG
jgi:hypothetical protein